MGLVSTRNGGYVQFANVEQILNNLDFEYTRHTEALNVKGIILISCWKQVFHFPKYDHCSFAILYTCRCD